jgi:hypothetical protein
MNTTHKCAEIYISSERNSMLEKFPHFSPLQASDGLDKILKHQRPISRTRWIQCHKYQRRHMWN